MIRVWREQGVTFVEFRPAPDPVDFKVLDEFGGTLLDVADTADPPRLVLDLSHTSYIGSGFVEQLLQAWRRLAQRQGRMALCGVNAVCLDVLSTTRLDALWPICTTRDQAVEAIASP